MVFTVLTLLSDSSSPFHDRTPPLLVARLSRTQYSVPNIGEAQSRIGLIRMVSLGKGWKDVVEAWQTMSPAVSRPLIIPRQ